MEPLRQLLWHLEHRRGMYLPDNSYAALTAFLTGYLLCWRDTRQDDVYQRLQTWLQAREQQDFALGWPDYILQHLARHDEQAATRQLFQLWREFLATGAP
jgi:hypothetical protein